MEHELDISDTRIIKGFAIILMLAHHLWAFPERLSGVSLISLFTIFNLQAPIFFGRFGKICVSIFFFLGGYGTYITFINKNFNIISKLKKLFIGYWKVFFIFIPIAFMFFRNQLGYENVYSSFSVKEFFNNLLALSSSYNGEWWFLKSYIIAIITSPFIKYVIDKFDSVVCYFLIIIYIILETNVLPSVGDLEILGYLKNNFLYNSIICESAPYIGCFWFGMLAYKDKLISKISNSFVNNNIKLNLFSDIFIIEVIIFLRQVGIGDAIDFIYIPFISIALLDICNRLKRVKIFLNKLGKQSTNMWLIHSFFCYHFYIISRVVIYTRFPLISLFELIIISYICSIALDKFWVYLIKIYNRIKLKIINDFND